MIVLTFVLASGVFGSGGLIQLSRLHDERRALGEQAFGLLAKNEDLRREIRELRKSDRALERLARQELGLVREGELVYRFRRRGPGETAQAPSGNVETASEPPPAH